MTHYTDKTSGIRYSQSQIDNNTRIAKAKVLEKQRDEFGYNFCVECEATYIATGKLPGGGIEYKIIDCSHDKSVRKCKDDGDIEAIWDVNNITPTCRYHHQIKDGNLLKN